jgi:hypothetical protein
MQVDVTSSSAPLSEAVDSVAFKGIIYRVGDWVHLANKDVPPKPIVAQVQRIDGYVLNLLVVGWDTDLTQV